MNKLSLQIIAVIVFIAIAGAALYTGGVFERSESGTETASANQEPREVYILKYSDYSCPACKVFIPAQQQLKRDFGDLVQIEYRYFPLDAFPHSRLAAYSAEAARNQDKFKEMHDLLFEHQSEWSPRQANALEYFTGFAEELELDMDQFLADIESDEIRAIVENQRQEGIRRSVNSTPSFFIDGHKLQQLPQDYDQFKSIVELYMHRSN